MNRGYQILIGMFATLGAVVFFMTSHHLEHTPMGTSGGYVMAVGLSVVAISCLVTTGRHITLRLTAGIVSAGFGTAFIGTIASGEFSLKLAFPLVISVLSGIYAFTGDAADSPLSRLFGIESPKKKKKLRRKPMRKRPRQRPLDE